MKMLWKRCAALCLSVFPAFGTFAACGTGNTETATNPEPTESPKEAKILKFLTIGHSLALDSCHILNLILSTEGFDKYDEIIIGTLYSGKGSLSKHVEFMLADSPAYDLYISSTKTPENPPTITKGVTARDAIVHDNWDIIIMQGGATENPQEVAFTDNRISAIQTYVNTQKTNPEAIFAWHMPWATPVDNDLRDMYPYKPNTYYACYERFQHQRSAFFGAVAGNVRKYIATNDTFRFIIPTGTTIENALSSFLEEKDLHRDYVHATDYARFIAAYTWYCRIVGIDKLEQIKLNAIPKAFLKTTQDKTQDRVLTDMEKAIALEAVNNALANPYEMTQSQYTTAPTE